MKKGIMNSNVMEVFNNEMEKQIGSAFIIANNEDKEVELTIKINIGILAKWKEVDDSDAGIETMIQPEMDFKVTRKVKETKVASEGIITDAELRFDEDGNPYLVKAKGSQVDMDEYMQQQREYEDITETYGEELKEEQKVIEFKREKEQLQEDSDDIDDDIEDITDKVIDVDYSSELDNTDDDDFFTGGDKDEV